MTIEQRSETMYNLKYSSTMKYSGHSIAQVNLHDIIPFFFCESSSGDVDATQHLTPCRKAFQNCSGSFDHLFYLLETTTECS